MESEYFELDKLNDLVTQADEIVNENGKTKYFGTKLEKMIKIIKDKM